MVSLLHQLRLLNRTSQLRDLYRARRIARPDRLATIASLTGLTGREARLLERAVYLRSGELAPGGELPNYAFATLVFRQALGIPPGRRCPAPCPILVTIDGGTRR